MARIFISGADGMDCANLAKLHLEKGNEVILGARRTASGSLWRLRELGIDKDVKIVDFELTDPENVSRVIREYKPAEFYNLAANSFVANSFKTPISVMQTNCTAILYELEAIRNYSPETKFYQASTSEMFGKVQEIPQCETTPFYPRSPYGIAKLAAHWLVKNYRESYGLFACSGILFNHEGVFRGEEFVTRKITKHVAEYKVGLTTDPLELGNMNALRDWGDSRDYIKAMYLMLQQDKPDDYVIATGEMHSVRDFVNEAYNAIGIDLHWEGEGVNEQAKLGETTLVKVNPEFFRPAEVEQLCGNAEKARQKLGWKPEVRFNELVSEMVEADIRRAKI